MTSWEELVFWGTDGSINLNWWLVLSTKVSVAIISWNWINIWGTFYSPYWSCTIAWQKSLTSLSLYFLLRRAQLRGLLLVSSAYTLETSKTGDVRWSHLKQKRAETKSSSLGRCFNHTTATRSSCFLLQWPGLSKTALTIDFCEGPRSPGVNVRQFGLNTPRIQAQMHGLPHGNSAKLRHESLPLWQRDQTRGLVGTLGKLKPNQEVLNWAGVGFECQCLTAVLPTYKDWLHKTEQTHLNFRRGKHPFL